MLAVSLFPFLSILACVIGTLALLIAALALGELTSTAQRHPGAIDAEELDALLREIETTSRALGDVLANDRELERLQAELVAMGFAPGTTAADLAREREDRTELARLERAARERDAEIEALEAAARQLENEVHAQTLPDEDARIQILPRGSGPPLAPYFVECRRDGVRIRRRDGRFSELLRLDDLVERGRLKVFLETLRVRGNATAIFLVRPDGVETFDHVERLATSQIVRFGKLAIPGDGPLDFQRYDATREAGQP